MNAPEKLPAAAIDPSTGEIETLVDSDFERLLQQPAVSARTLMLEDESFTKMMRIAELMASGRATVPKHLQGNVGDCMAVVMQAMRWDMDPFAVGQKTHVVNGALGYEAQLVNAVVCSSGAVSGHFHYQFRGTGANIEARVGAILRGDDDLTWGEWLDASTVKVKNSPLWAVNPKQQLGYLQVKNWARLYCPGAILGVYTPEDLAERIPDEQPRERGPRRKSAAAGPAQSPAPAAAETAAATTSASASNPATKQEAQAPAAAQPKPAAGSISGGQVAYLRNKLQAAGVVEQGICDRFQVAGIEHLSAEQFDTLKAELLAAA